MSPTQPAPQPTPHLLGVSNTHTLRLCVDAARRHRTDGLVCLTHPADWSRPAAWPLPARRRKPHGGMVVQEYRADAIDAWCDQAERPPRQARIIEGDAT